MTRRMSFLVRGKARAATVLIGLTALAGCASLSEGECLSGDWRAIGFEDGTKGRELDRINEHRKACGEYGVSPDLDLYRDGRDEGLLVYCTARKGFEEGRNNQTYRGVCPPELEQDFLVGYEDGQELYELRQEVNERRNEVNEIERDLKKARGEIRNKNRRLDEDGLSSEEREELQEDIRELRREVRDLERELRRAERALGRAESRASDFEDAVRPY